MKNRYPFIACAILLALAGPLFARQADTNAPDTNPAAIKPEEPDQNVVRTDEDFEPRREAIVSVGHDAVLKKGDTARTVVVIGANAKIEGKVRDVVVVIGGDMDVTGEIHGNAVTVFGDIHAKNGAILSRDVVAIGGSIDAADDVKIGGRPFEFDPYNLGKAVRTWFFQCVLKLRPLAPQVGWIWAIWVAFFLVYFLVALVLPVPVAACTAELVRRPATTFFMGLLTKILIPLVFGILIATGVGALVVPFVMAALIFGGIVGKVALFEFLGGAFGRRLGATILQNSLIAFLIGILIITVIYMVPVLGLIALGVVSVWGLGGAVTAAFWSLKREMPERKVVSPPPSTAPSAAYPGTAPTDSINLTAASNPDPPTSPNQMPSMPLPPSSPSGIPANVPEAYAYPRAGFWERMGAAFLDIVLVGFLAGIIISLTRTPQLMFLVALIYFSGMWAWKGTTIGGVVLGLKVVRLDGYPVTLLVSVVRGLAAAFSIVIFFLGFLWIIFDREKQGWHDKIAGTAVIKLPKGTPLVIV
jgi:uncharacterized RDD family membrane protein YckC